jgi:hypothetical protein
MHLVGCAGHFDCHPAYSGSDVSPYGDTSPDAHSSAAVGDSGAADTDTGASTANVNT